MPNVELAETAGLDTNNGIVVDQFARTSDEDIFAAGDCTNSPHTFYGQSFRLESVQNANDQATFAAKNICGLSEPYQKIPWFWSDQYDVKFQGVGLIEGCDDEVVTRFPEGGMAVLYKKEGALMALQAMNAPSSFMAARQELEEDLKQKLKQRQKQKL